MSSKKWEGKTGGGNFGQQGLFLLLRIFGPWFIYFVLLFIIPFYVVFAKHGSVPIYNYYRKHWKKSSFSAWLHTYWNHLIFGVMLIDRFTIYAGGAKTFKVKITGNENFLKAINDPQAFLIASSHIGNFEISGYLLSQDKKRINAVIYGGETEEIKKKRAVIFDKNKINPISVTDGFSHIFAINEAVKAGEIISMPCDRMFTGSKSCTFDFLEGQAEFPTGAFHIAAKFRIPVIAIFVVKESLTKYHVHVKNISETIAFNDNPNDSANKIAANFVGELEKIVRTYPNQWFNFYEFWK